MIGYWPHEKPIGTGPRHCPECGRETEHKLSQWRRYFLVLVPIPISRRRYFIECLDCGHGFEIDKADAKNATA